MHGRAKTLFQLYIGGFNVYYTYRYIKIYYTVDERNPGPVVYQNTGNIQTFDISTGVGPI